jgi:hypothetical protein
MLASHSPRLLWVVHSSLFVHFHIMCNFIFIHLLVLVLLHYLEVSILIVGGPVASLDLVKPLVSAGLKLRSFNLIFALR